METKDQLADRYELICEKEGVSYAYAQLIEDLFESNENAEQLKQQLKEANKVAEYYSDIDNFGYDYARSKLEEDTEDGISSREMCIKAKEYLTKYKVKE